MNTYNKEIDDAKNQQIKMLMIDKQITTTAINILHTVMNEFCECCIDIDGNTKAPTKKELMKIRGYLPSQYSMTLIKPK